MKKLISAFLSAVMIGSTLVAGSLSTSAAVAKPKMTSAKVNSSSAVTIKWKKVKKVKGYVIYRKTKGKAYSKIATVAASKTSYKATKLSPSTKYTFAIKAYKKSGKKTVYSAFSNAKSATTKAGYQLNKKTVTLTTYNEKTTVFIKGLNKNKYYSDLRWSSSDTNIAYASGYGTSTCTITAYKSGSCVVTATYGKKTYSCKVNVKMPASRCKLVKPKVPSSYRYIYRDYKGQEEHNSTIEISAIDCKFTDSYDGTVRLEGTVTGKKTFDKDGAAGNANCYVYCKLLDSSGTIVGTTNISFSNMRVGDQIKKDGAIYFSKLPADNYTLVFEDRYM